MNLIRIWNRCRALFRRQALEADMAEELRLHLEQRARENIAAGFSPEEARQAALRKFGGVEQAKELARERHGWPWLESWVKDLRHALRALRQSPGFTATALVTLALGIGASTAIFSVVNSILLRPLPFRDSDRLAVVWETHRQQGVKREGPSGPNFSDWREQSRAFADLAAVEIGSGTITGRGEPQQVPAMRVTTNLFSVLQARPALGRVFASEDGRGSRRALVVLSHGFWQSAFGADPRVVGKVLSVDQISYEVIGVLARDFWLPVRSDVFVPFPDNELRLKPRRLAHELGVFGRLQPDIAVTQAEAELNAIQSRLREKHPELAGWGVTVAPLQTVSTEYIRPALVALFGAVAFMLLIACANVANLLLARALGRSREVAVRVALGATRARLIRQFLTESLVLGALAGGLGTLLAVWGVSLLATVVPGTIPIPDAGAEAMLRPLAIDGRVLVFSLTVSLGTSLLFGLAPALHALRTDVIGGLKKGARGSVGSGRRLREILLVAEIALALVLLASAGLMLQSFARVQRAELGFRPEQVFAVEMELPTDSRYRTGPEQSAFFTRVLDAVRTLPGVSSAAVTSVLPLHNQDQRARFLIENSPALPPNERLQADFRRVSADYFQTMGIPLREGRWLENRDRTEPGAPRVGVVDEAFARRFFPEGNWLGRHLLVGQARIEIVGVVGDVKHAGVEREVRPTLYVSFQQSPIARMNLVVRSGGAPAELMAAVKHAVWSIDRDLPLYRIETMGEVVAEATRTPRLTLALLGGFAATALALAALGIYGVMSYAVSQRTGELGIRMALGAGGREIAALMLREGMRVVIVGVVLGLLAILALGWVVEGLLYQTSPHEPLALGAMVMLLALVALVACFFPARRAARVDPLVALRCE